MLSVEQIARVCHEVNRAYCRGIGDTSQKEWNEAADWQQASACNGIRFLQDKPDVTPEALHANWFKQKLADGWDYGEVKDEVAKTHPCMVAYNELPADQKTKDYLFQATARTLLEVNKELDIIAKAVP